MKPTPRSTGSEAVAERAFREAVGRAFPVDWPADDPLFVGQFEYCQHDRHGTARFCRTNPSAWVVMPPAVSNVICPNVIRLRIHDTGPHRQPGPALIIPFPARRRQP